jgi:diguanylate cyclase (GGDEF)-like protein
MSQTGPSLEEQLRAIREGFAQDLPRRLQAIESSWLSLTTSGWNTETLGEVHRLVHNLTGAGKTFGFGDISETARAFEVLLKAAKATPDQPGATAMTELETALAGLRTCIQESVRNRPASGATSGASPAGKVPQNENLPLLYLAEDDVMLANDLALQLRHYGYQIEHFPNLAALDAALSRRKPNVLLLDFYLPDGDGAGAARRWGKASEHSIPVIMISASTEIETRLMTVRSGADAFLVKPVDILQLTELLDRLCTPQPGDPYRVLVVEDSVSQAQYVQSLLQEAGMLVSVITRPLQTLDAIQKLDPDVILLDMHMPDCNGLELATVIRQHPAYTATSIVFLSSEADIQKQLQTLQQGADEFLGKPIDPRRLVSVTAARATRARILRAMMTCDSLTGLLNHTAILDRLDSEMARATRAASPLCVAMIDIDKFKSVNDSYGHLVGDQVIKSLTQLLRQRLRKSDSLGRMGGEEFLVVMPDTAPEQACKVMNNMREHFEQVAHRLPKQNETLRSTFSCGVAAFRSGISAAQLVNQADQAMYQAKYQGRNRVMLATDG